MYQRIIYGLLLVMILGQPAGAVGLRDRVANTTLRMPETPPLAGYAVTNAFGGLALNVPVCIVTPPGETNRLFILEKSGRIVVLTNLAASANPTVFMDLSFKVNPAKEAGLGGMAFHPGYRTNRYFYLFYSLNTVTTNLTGSSTNLLSGLHERVSRFETSPVNPNRGLVQAELPLITQYDEDATHNAGDLHFGPDGYLYISVGDEGLQNDMLSNSQRIDKDFFSGILRIDVDKRPGNLAPTPHAAHRPRAGSYVNSYNLPGNPIHYAIPADNPFVGATTFNGLPVDASKLRGEFWAVGLRNPWRMSFDPVTGDLYCGDVGGDQWEEVNVVVKGGNYGWAWREGTINGPKAHAAPVAFGYMRPIAQFTHGSGTMQGKAVIGGLVYRGSRISQLYGKYIFADYELGNVWALTPNGTNPVTFQRLTGEAKIAAFGTDPRNGDVLMADLDAGTLKRLVYSDTFTGTPLPPTLADTGAFADLATLTPHAGVVPYELNVPFWSDHAIKTRWFAVPDLNRTIGFDRGGNWAFPPGTVWIKHFELELISGVPASRKRLETRFLVRNVSGVHGVTYRWDASGANASLVPEQGMDDLLVVRDGTTTRTQVWHYPGRAECLACHTRAGGYALGFNTAQLNRALDYGGVVENQLAALGRAGYFSAPPADLHTMPALARPDEQSVSLTYRVHSYLAANCAQCHQGSLIGPGVWDARISTPMSLAGIINGELKNFGTDTNNRVVVPGSPAASMLLTRISTLGPGRMPPLATSLLDTNAIQLVKDWIDRDLPDYLAFPDWQRLRFGSTNAPQAHPDADPDHDGADNFLEFLTETDPLSGTEVWSILLRQSNGLAEIVFLQPANRGCEVQWTESLLWPVSWKSLDAPANRPFFPARASVAIVPDSITGATARFYRVRLFEP